MTIEQSSTALKYIIQQNLGAFHHPRLSALDTLFTFEVEILDHLIDAQCALIRLQMIQSLLHLKEAKDRLRRWLHASSHFGSDMSTTTEKATSTASWIRRLGESYIFYTFIYMHHFIGGTPKQQNSLALCVWMNNFYNLLLSKFSLYFYESLLPLSNVNDMKTNVSAIPSPNFLHKFAAFYRKYDPLFVCIVIDRTDESTPYAGLYSYIITITLTYLHYRCRLSYSKTASSS